MAVAIVDVNCLHIIYNMRTIGNYYLRIGSIFYFLILRGCSHWLQLLMELYFEKPLQIIAFLKMKLPTLLDAITMRA